MLPLTSFYCLGQKKTVGRFIKTYIHGPVTILQLFTSKRIEKCVTEISVLNNKPPVSWVI